MPSLAIPGPAAPYKDKPPTVTRSRTTWRNEATPTVGDDLPAIVTAHRDQFACRSLCSPFGPGPATATTAAAMYIGSHDLVLVAELMGHARVETTRGYSLPTDADRQSAIDSLPTDR